MDKWRLEPETDYTDYLEEHGYDWRDYNIGLQIYDASNQVLHIQSHRAQKCYHVPVECNVFDWPWKQVAETVVEALDDHKFDEYPGFLNN